MLKSFKSIIKEALLRTDLGYRLLHLRLKEGVVHRPTRWPKGPPANSVLKKKSEWAAVVQEVKDLGLPRCRDLPKNWDSLAAIGAIRITYTIFPEA